MATKANLGILRSEMDWLRSGLKGDLAKLDGRLDALEGRFVGLEGQLDGRFVGLEGRLDAKIAEAREATRTWAIGTMLTMLSRMAGRIVAIVLVKP